MTLRHPRQATLQRRTHLVHQRGPPYGVRYTAYPAFADDASTMILQLACVPIFLVARQAPGPEAKP
jgi:hypothetical protein